MFRIVTVAALAAVTLWPEVPAAQETPRSRPRARTEQRGFTFSFNRGRIGVIVNTDADADGDKVGARIDGVTPGGPADKAGLKAGDVISRFGGTALGGVAAENDDESGPGMKLIELARALDPGDTVQVDYRRGTDARKATIVADDVRFWGSGPEIQIPDFDFDPPRVYVGPGTGFGMVRGGAWGGIELVTLNPDLGEYFGTREGVLVVKAEGDSTLPLKGGDVILAIGGRKPSSPAHAMRIIGSYEAGESVTIDVLRKRNRTTLTWKVPERTSRFRLMPTPRRQREAPSALRWKQPHIEILPLKVRRVTRAI